MAAAKRAKPKTKRAPAPKAPIGTRKPTFTVFLDRDGVLDKDKWPGILSWRMWEWLPGARESLAALNRPDVQLSLATNQPWTHFLILSRGRLARLHARMLEDIRASGGRLDRIEAAQWPISRRRKPNPGMLEDAAAAFGGIDKGRAVMVGDKVKDMEAARRFGIRGIRVGPEGDVPDLAAALPLILEMIDA